jgi:hypothetical protein
MHLKHSLVLLDQYWFWHITTVMVWLIISVLNLIKLLRSSQAKRISDVRNFQVLENKGSKVVGIDVSIPEKQIGLLN